MYRSSTKAINPTPKQKKQQRQQQQPQQPVSTSKRAFLTSRPKHPPVTSKLSPQLPFKRPFSFGNDHCFSNLNTISRHRYNTRPTTPTSLPSSSHPQQNNINIPAERSETITTTNTASTATVTTKQQSTLHTAATASPPTQDPEEQPQLPPPKYRFPIPPQRLKRLPHQNTIRDALFNPLTHLDPTNFIYPDYALLMDFQEKESLLDWQIITDAELNGTSEASIAWGTAKNPITGESMRTLVFQGRLGDIILPKRLMNEDQAKVSMSSLMEGVFAKKKRIQDAHGRLIQQAATDPDVDFGDTNMVDASGKLVELDQRILAGNEDKDTAFSQNEFGAVHGYVGLMSPSFVPPLDLHWWDTLNICVRTDNGPWLASAKPITMSNEELYMAGIPGPDGKVSNPRKPTGFLRRPMRNLFVPIESLSVTRAGRGNETHDVSDARLFDGFGFSIRGPSGPFKIEIGWIAVANSEGNLQKEELLPVPKQSLKVNISPQAIIDSTMMNDAQLYAQTHLQKARMDLQAKEEAKALVQASSTQAIKPKFEFNIEDDNDLDPAAVSIFSQSSIINIDEITTDRVSTNLRKKQLAKTLGVSEDQVQDLIQDRNSLETNLAFDPSVEEYAELPAHAQKTIESMTKLLEPTHTRRGRSEYGATGYTTVDPKTGQQLTAAPTDMALFSNQQSSLDSEEDLLRLQRKAQKLTGQAIPLIVPTYANDAVMAQTRFGALQAGLVTEKQWEHYTTTDWNMDMHKNEKRLQQLESRLFRRAYEHQWSDTASAARMRTQAKTERGFHDEQQRKSWAEDAYYASAGRVKTKWGDDPNQQPPADLIEVYERLAYDFKGDRPEYQRLDDGIMGMDNPDLQVNANQTRSWLSYEPMTDAVRSNLDGSIIGITMEQPQTDLNNKQIDTFSKQPRQDHVSFGQRILVDPNQPPRNNGTKH